MRTATHDILAKLVSFDTTSRFSNLPLIEWVEAYLSTHDIPHIRVDYMEGKTNLFATIGPDVAGGIVLSGHTDVVPVDGQDWASPPFELTEREGKLYARGAADMKGFLAACLALVPYFKTLKLKTPIQLAFSCDEEVGCKGVRPLIAHMKNHIKKPRAVFVGEPTGMKVVNGHKSAATFNTEVIGHEAHSSLTNKGVNAILVAGEVLAEISALRREFVALGDASGRYDPPYSTVHVGTITGGTARNIIPKRCSLLWESRLLPGADNTIISKRMEALRLRLEPEMKAISSNSGITTIMSNNVPGLMPQPQEPAELMALQATGDNATHAVSYCTEAGLFQQQGLPTIICGPGNIDAAHKPNEFVDVSQLTLCESYLTRLAAACC